MRRLTNYLALLTAVCLGSGNLTAQGIAAQTESVSVADDESALPSDRPAGEVPSIDDRRQLAAFLDGFITSQLADQHVAGATVSVVVGDDIVFSRGYGFANVDQQTRVDPATTMFRIGSVSKLFLWTALMKLVEQGKLDLHKDVNVYLDGSEITVPATFDEPITVLHLMCHTAGFEDYVIGLFGRNPEDLKPIQQILRDHLPRRVFPPGVVSSYSNYGSLLAAVVIERVSGMTWEAFVQQQILGPLESSNVMLDQPPEDRLPKTLSKGYSYDKESGAFKTEGFEYIPIAPAGCIAASADEMARFMIAHLNQGKFKDRRILEPKTIAQMQSRSHWHDQRLDAMCYGFWELNRNGQRILQHGGDTELFHSLLAILPDHKVGIFVSYNTSTGAGLRERLLDAVLQRYYPVERTPPVPAGDFGQRADRFAGSYKMLRYDQSSITKLSMVVQVLTVKPQAGNRLSINGKSYIEVEPLMFQAEHGPERIAFRESDSGAITHLFINSAPAISFARSKWYESQSLHIGILVASALIFASVILGWPLVYLITRGEWIAGARPTRWSRRASWFGWFVAVSFVVFLLMVGLQADEIVHGISPLLNFLLNSSPLLGLMCVGVILFSIVSWINRYWRLSGRVHYLLLALASAGLLWQLIFFNIVKLNL